jgi:hypothetical protein
MNKHTHKKKGCFAFQTVILLRYFFKATIETCINLFVCIPNSYSATTISPCDFTTAVAREQLCGHANSSATKEHALAKEAFSVRSVAGLHNKH